MEKNINEIEAIRNFIESSFELPTGNRDADIQKDIHELVGWINSIWGVMYDAELLARALFDLGYRFTTGEVPQWHLCSKIV